MAFTVSSVIVSDFGNVKVVLQDVTTDSTENTWATGCSKILGYLRMIQSGNTDSTAVCSPPTAINVGTTATVIAGNMAMTSCQNTTTYRFLVFGAA